jgi:hypothetical protein
MALSFDVSPTDREVIDEIAERAIRGASVSAVTRGLDPRVHLLRKRMDRRVKPGDDSGWCVNFMGT